ncbi:hypothetical protein MACK_003148 [Theileria orientalis]|uniref:Uncharacterized protein n=1 Tax=Theileria orientalis TaxID=68886 RepID=A0A976SI67_THEOR|nr:hypothetical protein MACK_003148 [Theileria orientalis]
MIHIIMKVYGYVFDISIRIYMK